MDAFTDTPSTVIDTDAGPSASGGGAPQLTEPVDTKADVPLSLRAELEDVFKEDKSAEPKPDAKQQPAPAAKEEGADKADAKEKAEPEAEKKPEEAKADKSERQRAEDGKFARREDDKAPVQRHEAPKNFLPAAKDVWRNTPHAVQSEVARMAQEHEETTKQFRESHERYEPIRQFDEIARGNGRDLRQSLERVVHVENMLQRNPIAGLNAILAEVGPRKADGQPFSLFEVAQHIVQSGPQGYQQMVAQSPQQQQQTEDPRVAQLQQRLQEMETRQLESEIITPFKTQHPRYDELEADIAFFLQSGKIPQSLSPIERLAAAYDMAERINPPSHVDRQQSDAGPAPEQQRRADEDFSGSKSIKSSPGSVTETFEPEAKAGESIRDSILRAGRQLTRA